MERTKEDELNIVLKNYDKLKAERDRYQKENEDLKKELAQQKIIYKNMLDRFSGKHSQDWESQYKRLKGTFNKINGERSVIAGENRKMKQMLDSIRGVFCNAHNRLDSLCEELSISHRGEDSLSQYDEKPKPLSSVTSALIRQPQSQKELQQAQFVRYIRNVVTIYKNTGTLNGISTLAQTYGVTTITKVKFFQYGLDKEPLTDERILEVYQIIKKK